MEDTQIVEPDLRHEEHISDVSQKDVDTAYTVIAWKNRDSNHDPAAIKRIRACLVEERGPRESTGDISQWQISALLRQKIAEVKDRRRMDDDNASLNKLIKAASSGDLQSEIEAARNLGAPGPGKYHEYGPNNSGNNPPYTTR